MVTNRKIYKVMILTKNMAIEDLMADAFNRIVAGQQINERIGDWAISNLNSPSLIDLMYVDVAIYGFQVGVKDDSTQFYNYHREARKGTGTESLKQLESSFDILARNRVQKVIALFDTFGQEDTEVWLKRNGYTLNEQRVYQKIFDPKVNPSPSKR